MVTNGPVCARCGTLLRWLGGANVWGCDRCQVTYPVQQPAVIQPQVPHASAGPRKRTALWIGVGAAVAITGAVTAAVALSGGGGGGKGDPKALLEAVLDAVGKGDEQALLGLSIANDSAMADAFVCKDDDKTKRQAAEARSMYRKDIEDRLPEWKDLTATVVSIEPRGKADVTRANENIDKSDDCKAKVDLTMQDFKATVRVHSGAGSGTDDEVKIRFTAAEIAGRWYLLRLPEAPAVGDVRKMKDMRDAMCACRDAACADKVDHDFDALTTSMMETYKHRSPDQKVMAIAEEMAACRDAAKNPSR